MPDFGQKSVHKAAAERTLGVVMLDRRLLTHLVATTELNESEAARVAQDVLAFHAESTEAFVRRRHAELQSRGMRNPEIFAQVASELTDRLVAAPSLSERQLRRIVYG